VSCSRFSSIGQLRSIAFELCIAAGMSGESGIGVLKLAVWRF
jgi:hypothetical protein